MPGVAAALHQYWFFFTPGTSRPKTPLLTAANEIAHEDCGRPLVM